jgi:hypothetical protein
MLEETYYVGAYWDARREEVGECARRAELFLHMLAQCDASLGQWYPIGRVRRGAQRLLVKTDDRQELEKLLLRGRNRATSNRSVVEELGFGLHVFNKSPEAGRTYLDISCGVYAKWVSNVCLLVPPSRGEISERLLTVPVLAQVMECMVKAWDPDCGVVASDNAIDLIPQTEKWDVRVGWLTYFARRLGTVPPLPAPVSIKPVGELGTLVILTPERFTVSNPEHIAQGLRVRDLLNRAGLLSRPHPESLE